VVSLLTGMGATAGPYAGGLILLVASYRTLWLVMVVLACAIALLFLHMESLDKQLKLRSPRMPVV
jgi:MFS family permease